MHQPRTPRLRLSCLNCEAIIEVTESELKRRAVKFCSSRCFGIATRKPLGVEITCNQCGKTFRRRRDKVQQRNYCSYPCSNAARREPLARWNDPNQIREYNRSWRDKNNARVLKNAARWRADNPSKRKEIQKRYRDSHKEEIALASRARRAKSSSDAVTVEDWMRIRAEYGDACALCGIPQTMVRLEMDHIIPLAKGGEHKVDNIQPLCRTCNASKGTKIAC